MSITRTGSDVSARGASAWTRSAIFFAKASKSMIGVLSKKQSAETETWTCESPSAKGFDNGFQMIALDLAVQRTAGDPESARGLCQISM